MIVGLFLIVHMTSHDISRDGAQRTIIANDNFLWMIMRNHQKKKRHIFQSDDYEMDNQEDSPSASTEEDYFKRMKRRSKVNNEDTWSEKDKKISKKRIV